HAGRATVAALQGQKRSQVADSESFFLGFLTSHSCRYKQVNVWPELRDAEVTKVRCCLWKRFQLTPSTRGQVLDSHLDECIRLQEDAFEAITLFLRNRSHFFSTRLRVSILSPLGR